MKIIDLLNKIASGEEVPKKVKYDGVIYKNKDGDLLNDIDCSLFEHRSDKCEKLLPMLNDEVEIEEEKKIPENNFNYIYSCEDEHIMANFENIKTTLKDIIDFLKSKGE